MARAICRMVIEDHPRIHTKLNPLLYMFGIELKKIQYLKNFISLFTI